MPNTMPLTQAEQRIISILRANPMEKMTLFFRDGEPCRIHGTQHLNPDNSFKQICAHFPYQEITIQQEAGKQVYVRRTFKIKL